MNRKKEKIVRYDENEAKRMRGATNWARMIQEENTEKKKVKEEDKNTTP
jgi:hypothetical protein